LKAFKQKHGHLKTGAKLYLDKSLNTWVVRQRTMKKRMPSWRKELLDDIGFVWQIRPPLKTPIKTWEEHYEALTAFYQNHQHCRVPRNWKEDPRLGEWAAAQRCFYKKNQLNETKKAQLDLLDFKSSILEDNEVRWDKSYQKLIAFKAKFGHCNITRTYVDQPLARWVEVQRTRQHLLSQKRKNLLNNIGFVWRFPATTPWQQRYEELVAFKAKFGHCDVRNTGQVNEWQSLGYWVNTMRTRYQKGKLEEDKISQLEQLNFKWRVLEANWQASYEQLKAYYLENGHCQINTKSRDFTSLGYWVRNQRRNREKLSQEKKDLLNALNFDWVLTNAESIHRQLEYQNRANASWMKKYEALQDFYKKQGHCNVPKTVNHTLGQWVIYQRRQYHKQRLSAQRIDLLNQLGFEWSRRGKGSKK